MNALRLHIGLLALLQALAYPTSALLGGRWSIALSIASVSVAVLAMWTSRGDLVAPHQSQRADSYRTAAHRAEDTQPAVRPAKPKRRVLSWEFVDAKRDREGWALAFVAVSLAATFAGALLYAGDSWALVPTIVLAGAVVACAAGFAWCERIVRAWRDQERGDR
jgi:hypothetical protein